MATTVVSNVVTEEDLLEDKALDGQISCKRSRKNGGPHQPHPKRRNRSPPPATQPDADDLYWEIQETKDLVEEADAYLATLSNEVGKWDEWCNDEERKCDIRQMDVEPDKFSYEFIIDDKVISYSGNSLCTVAEHLQTELETLNMKGDNVCVRLHVDITRDYSTGAKVRQYCCLTEVWKYRPAMEASEEERPESQPKQEEKPAVELYDPKDDAELPKGVPTYSLLCWLNHGIPVHYLILDDEISKEARDDLFALRGYICTDYSSRDDASVKDQFNAMHRIGARLEDTFDGGNPKENWARWKCPRGNYAARSFVSRLYVTGYSSDACEGQ